MNEVVINIARSNPVKDRPTGIYLTRASHDTAHETLLLDGRYMNALSEPLAGGDFGATQPRNASPDALSLVQFNARPRTCLAQLLKPALRTDHDTASADADLGMIKQALQSVELADDNTQVRLDSSEYGVCIEGHLDQNSSEPVIDVLDCGYLPVARFVPDHLFDPLNDPKGVFPASHSAAVRHWMQEATQRGRLSDGSLEGIREHLEAHQLVSSNVTGCYNEQSFQIRRDALLKRLAQTLAIACETNSYKCDAYEIEDAGVVCSRESLQVHFSYEADNHNCVTADDSRQLLEQARVISQRTGLPEETILLANADQYLDTEATEQHESLKVG